MTTREGIEIDYCPTCRGVWLDRGELDKIIERSATATGPARAGAAVDAGAGDRDRRYAPVVPYDEPQRGYRRGDDDDDDRRYGERGYGDRDDRGQYGKRKRRSFLDDLFDFD
jgi:Zn-finger nucleic acid-binding protein